jgi:L-rhamnose mutarotase
MKRFCLACDLKDDEEIIKEYDAHHRRVAPEIIASIVNSGITVMDIYRAGNRMFMIMEVTDDFSFEEKARADAADPVVVEWEQLMWKYQQALPFAKPGEKWVIMDKIFELNK